MNFKAFVLTGFVIQTTLTLPAVTLFVTSNADSGAGSLRDIVAFSSAGDLVRFNITGSIVLTGTIPIPHNLYIHGPGPLSLTIDANKAGRAFDALNGPVEISAMTIQNGLVVGTAGTDGALGMTGGAGSGASGGAVYATCDVVLSNCWITGNTVIGGVGGRGGDNVLGTGYKPGSGGAGGLAFGGAVYEDNILFAITAIKCTFSSNTAIGGKGGTGGHNYNFAVMQPGGTGGTGGTGGDGAGNFLFLTNCTFSGNQAIGGQGGQGGDSDAPTAGGDGGQGGTGQPGGLFLGIGGTIICCTVVSNSAIAGLGGAGGSGSPNGSAGVDGSGYVGGILGNSYGCDRHMGNTVVANNFATTYITNLFVSVDDLGYNFLGDNFNIGSCVIGPTTRVGTVATPLDPLLGPLVQNGGGIPTHSPLNGSPLIGWGYRFGTISDERGAARPFGVPLASGGDGSDVGAFEFGSPPIGLGKSGTNVVVSWPASYGDFTLQSASDLGAPSNWINVTDTPVVIDDQFVVSNSMVGPARFYRLINH